MSFNASAVVQALPLFDSLPSFPALAGDSAATPAAEKAPVPRSPHAQEFALDLQVRLHSLTADLMTDACARVATLSLEKLGVAFSQGAASHIAASLHNITLTDATPGCGRYPSVLRVSELDELDEADFFRADLYLAGATDAFSLTDTSITCSIKAPVLTLRARFLQELLAYLDHGCIHTLLAAPASQPAATVAPAGTIHSSALRAVSSVFRSLVEGNVLKVSASSSSLLLPKVHVALQNLVVLIPSSSESEELLRFELGKLDAENDESAQGSSRLSLHIDGMNAVTAYHMEGDASPAKDALTKQYVLNNLRVHCCVELSTALSVRVGVTPVHVTVNQHQLEFIAHRLLRNFSETAQMVYPEVVAVSETAVSETPSKEVTVSETPAKEVTVGETPAEETAVSEVQTEDNSVQNAPTEAPANEATAASTVAAISCPEVRVEVVLEAVKLELLREDGGYSSETEIDLSACGTNAKSVTVLGLNRFLLFCGLTQRDLTVGLELGSVELEDSRKEAVVDALLKRPVRIGDECESALSVLCRLDEEVTVCAEICRLRVFVAPLFAELLSIAASLSSTLASPVEPAEEPEEKAEKPEEGTEQGIALPPFLAALLPHVHVTVAITPISLFFPSSFTTISSLLLLSLSPSLSLSFSPQLDIAAALALTDIRVAQATAQDLSPCRDYLDVMQSWTLLCDVACKDAFHTISASVSSPKPLQLAMGYRDVLIALKCAEEFTKLLKANQTESVSTTPATQNAAVPVIALPLLVSAESRLAVTVSLQLPSLQLEVINDIGVAELPFVQLALTDITASASLDSQLLLLLQFSLAAEFYNYALIAWEPLVEPWSVLAQVTQKDVRGERSMGGEAPCQSTCTLQAENMLNVNVSHAFVLASLQLLHDLEAVQTHATHTESGYYIYVDNELGQDVVFEVVFDGGFGSQVKKIRKDWEAVEQKEKTLLKRGLLLMSSTQPSQQSSSQQSSSQQSLSQQSPSQLVCVELYSVEPFLRVTSASADGAVSTSVEGSIQWCEDALGVFACSLDTPEGRVPAFFSACDENSASAWRALQAHSTVSAAAPSEETLLVPAHSTRRSSLPAHPSLPALHSAESYNQRIVSLSIPECAAIEFCCDAEAELPFSVHSPEGAYRYDVLVSVTNKEGIRCITVSSLLAVRNFACFPLLCRFVEDVPREGCQVDVKQTQKKQVNLEDDTNNVFGVAVGSNNAAFDTKTPGVAIRRFADSAEGFTELKQNGVMYDPAPWRMKGRLEIRGPQPDALVCSFSERDITSLNLRRACVNVGSAEHPQYCLLRVKHYVVRSEHLESIAHAQEGKKTSDVLAQLERETVEDVFGAYEQQRSVFSIECVPVLVLRNLLPMPLEYRVLRRDGELRGVEAGELAAGEARELVAVNGGQKERFFIAVRPLNQQFVWNNEVIPIEPACSGSYKLSDMENSGTALEYEYAFAERNQLELSVSSPYWVLNRSADDLLITDAEKRVSQFVPGNTIVFGEAEDERTLKPAIFGVAREKKTVIALKKKTSNWSTLTTLVKDQAVQVVLPASPPFDPKQAYYAVTTKQMSAPFAKTRLITIYPLFVFRNQSDADVEVDDGQSSFALPANSIREVNAFSASSKGVVFSLTRDGRTLHSPLLSVRDSAQYDFVMNEDFDAPQPAFFRLDLGVEDSQRVLTFSAIEPRKASYCLSNRSCLTSLRVLQVGCDWERSVVVPPLSSAMFALPNPCGPKEVLLFVENVLQKSEQRFAVCMMVNLEGRGKTGVVRREDLAEAVEVVMENENATRILVLRAEEKQEGWLVKKGYEHKQILLEEALNRLRFEYASATKEATTFTAAFDDFEKHALSTAQLAPSSNVQPAVMAGKGAQETLDLMLNDHYFWVKAELVSVRNLQRRPCGVQLRVSNNEMMAETELKKGAHVHFGKEMVFRGGQPALFVQVAVVFERARLELRAEINLEEFAEFNRVQRVCLPLTPAGYDEASRALCSGGCVVAYIVHCKNNRVTDAQKEYLPSLLFRQFCCSSQLQVLTAARTAVAYEAAHAGRALQGLQGLQGLDEAVLRVGDLSDDLLGASNIHLQQALHSPSQQSQASQEETAEEEAFERSQHFAVELEEVANLNTTAASLFAAVECDGQRYAFGEAAKITPPPSYAPDPVVFVLKSMKSGCAFSLQEDGRFIVTKVVKDSEADRSGVCVGMVLWSINEALVSGDTNIKERLSLMKRPVKLSLLPPFRPANQHFVSAVWKSRVVLPKGVTLGKTTVSLVIRDAADAVVFEKELKVRRFHAFEGFEGKANALTSCHVRTAWTPEEKEAVVDTQVSVTLPGLAVSLLNAQPVEVLAAYLTDLRVTWACDSRKKQSAKVTLQRVQIDNQLLNALSPVLLGVTDTTRPFLDISAVLLHHPFVPYFASCDVRVSPLFLAMDNRLLVALIQVVGSIPFHLLSSGKIYQILAIPEFRPNSAIVLHSAPSPKLFVDHLRISDLSLTLSNKIDPATTVTGVFLPPSSFFLPLQTVLDTLCGLVANIDETKIQLDGYALTRFFGHQSDLVSGLMKHFVPQATRQVLKVLGSVNLLGNPVGLIDDVKTGIKAFAADPAEAEGGKVLIQSTTKGVLNTVAKVTGTLSDGVAALSFNKHYKEQRILGRKGFIHGLASGMTGVVMDPVRGAKKGVKGLLEGVGTGLVGVVTKPVSGLLDDATKLMETAKNSIVQQKVVTRVRLPLCVLCDHVLRGFDEKLAFGQELYFTATTRYRVDSQPGEQYIVHCCVDQSTHYFVLTQYHCMLLSPTADLLWFLPVRGLAIEVDDEEMRLIARGESKLVLFADKDVCSRLYGILLNLPGWSAKEIVQCCSGFYGFVRHKGKRHRSE